MSLQWVRTKRSSKRTRECSHGAKRIVAVAKMDGLLAHRLSDGCVVLLHRNDEPHLSAGARLTSAPIHGRAAR